MPAYDLIYAITKFSNSDNISRQEEDVTCTVCGSVCRWYNHDLVANLCSTECELKVFEDKLTKTEDYQFLIRYSPVDDNYIE